MSSSQQSDNTLVQQTDRLRTLNEISRVLSSTLDLGTLYETIYQQVGRVTGTTSFFIALRSHSDPIDLAYCREMGELYQDVEAPSGPSVTRLVLERGTPVLFSNAGEYQEFCQQNGVPMLEIGDREKMPDATESMLYVPLNTGQRTIGVLSVQSVLQNAYTDEDVQTLSVIASQAAVAIENARLYQESQNSIRQMHVLLAVAQTIGGSLDLQTVLDAILAGMREVVPYYNAEILLPDVTGGYLEVVGSMGSLADQRRRQARIPFGEGVTGRVFTTGEALIAPDVTVFPGYISDGSEIRSEMAVALKQGDEVVGVLNVEQTQPAAFSPKDLNSLLLFASQAAIAIENARLYTEQQNRVFELQTIQSIVQKLTPLHDIAAMAALIDTELRRLIDYHACRLFVLDPDGEVLVMVGEAERGESLQVKVGQGITGWIARYSTSIMIGNTLEDHRVHQIEGTPHREESMIGVPLIYEGKVRGVITLSKLGVNRFDENQLRLLEILAAQTAIALDRARLYNELRAEAVTDPLTQLYNRRYLADRFHEEQARAERNQHILAVIMIDIDKFKRINDTFGHDAGDAVLEDLAHVLRSVVRAGDIVARYGGEEFCILLLDTSLDASTRVAERMRSLIEQRELPGVAHKCRVTVSVGLAVSAPGRPDFDLFSHADFAMYEAKRRGGNALCVSRQADWARDGGNMDAAGS